MFFMPPQEGKSQRGVAVAGRVAPRARPHPPHRHRVLRVGVRGAVGRQIKATSRRTPTGSGPPHGRLQGSRRWETTAGGGIVCVGIRGALTGKPLDVLIIDDPVKDRAAAESRPQRDAAWEFWEQVAELRLSRPAAGRPDR